MPHSNSPKTIQFATACSINAPVIVSAIKTASAIDLEKIRPPYIVKSFFLENQGISNVSSINISEERAIGMDISLYLVRK